MLLALSVVDILTKPSNGYIFRKYLKAVLVIFTLVAMLLKGSDRSGIINMPHGHMHTRAVKLYKMHMHKVQLRIWIETTMGT